MQSYIGIIVLCSFSGFLSCAVSRIYNRVKGSDYSQEENKSDIDYIIKTFAFYFMVTYTILSLFKTLLGNGNGALTLIESYDEVSWRTYLHYSIPLTVISIVVPFILRIVLKEKRKDFISMFLSLIIFISAVFYLLFDRISNIQYLCIAVAGAVFAFVISFLYKGEVQYCTRTNLKKRLASIVPVFLFWIILMVLYLPNELYLGNINDMDLPYGIFVRTMLLEALMYFVVYTVFTVCFMTERQFGLLCEIIFAITAGCYLQGILLNGKLEVLDGSMQTWSILQMIVNLFIWIAIIGLSIGLKYIFKRDMMKIYSAICIYLSIIQLVTWGYLGLTADFPKVGNNLELTTDARLELDPENNVIVFVLDWFDVQIADKILAKDENFMEPLHDFTWYKNTTSAYAYTAMSIPYLLTDVEWQYDMKESDYMKYAFSNSTLLKDIADRNYDIGIYTSKKYVSSEVEDIVTNYINMTTQGWNYKGIMEQMLHCSKYKSYPFVLKANYRYTGGDIFMAIRHANVHSVSNDTAFYEDLVYTGIEIRDNSKYDGAFRFYHLNGVHPPVKTDLPTMGQRSLEMVYEYLDQMKAAGIYDDATIIITADHGHNYLNGNERLYTFELDMASSPILFVKRPNETHQGEPRISMAPVSHAEMGASIIEAVNGDVTKYGDTFEDIGEDSQRIRYFEYRRRDDIPYRKYEINGNVSDWSNWTIIEGEKAE